MAQASSWWKQIRYPIAGSSMNRVQSQLVKSLSRKRIRKTIKWAIAAFVLGAMVLWNWKLVLATIAGIGLMLLVYFMQGWKWEAYLSQLRQYFSGSQGRLTVAVGSGGFAALSTYIAASIWADSENRWLATGTILQGLGTIVTIVLLIWHAIGDRIQREEAKFEQLLQDLTSVDVLKRLIAVRQLTHLTNKSRFRQLYQQQIVEYFCIAVVTEREPVVRDALLRSLQKWKIPLPTTKSDRASQIPIDLKRVYREVEIYE